MNRCNRFVSEAQILSEIDECHAEAKRSLERAEAFELQLENQRHKRFEMERSQIDQLKIEIRKARTYATYLLEDKAVKLGEKLSVLRTGLLKMGPIVEHDASIPRKL